MHTVNTACTVTGVCDKVLDKMEKLKKPHRKDLVIPLVDALSFLGNMTLSLTNSERIC